MKKAMKIFGIIARTNKFVTILFVTALIGFSMAACGGDDGPGGGGGGGGAVGPGTRSGLIVTGLPDGSWSIQVFAQGMDLSPLSNGQFISPAQGRENYVDNDRSFFQFGNNYSPTGRKEVVLFENRDRWQTMRRATVNFTDGKATVPYSSFTPLPYYN